MVVVFVYQFVWAHQSLHVIVESANSECVVFLRFRSFRIQQPWCSSYWPHRGNLPWEPTNMRRSVCIHIFNTVLKNKTKRHSQVLSRFCLHVCAFLQSVNWSRGPRRNWKWQRREQAKRSRSWKTNSKPAERTSTTLRQRLENWKRTETIKSTERRTNMLMDAISWSNFLCSCPLQGFNKQTKKVNVVICLRIFAFYFCWASKGILNM